MFDLKCISGKSARPVRVSPVLENISILPLQHSQNLPVGGQIFATMFQVRSQSVWLYVGRAKSLL